MTVVAPPDPAIDALVGSPVNHHLVTRPWGAQHVVRAGTPGAPAVLLVHGWPQHWLAWRHVIAALAPHADVLALDLRGFGWSTTTRPDPPRASIAEMADDLPAVLDHFGIDRAGLAAHDWGGWIAFRAVLDHPSRFRAHASLAIMPPWLSWRSMARHLDGWGYVFPMALAGHHVARHPAWVRAMVDRSTWASPWASADGRAAMASYLEQIDEGDSAAMTHHLYRSFVLRELRAALGPRPPRLQVPTTVVVGEHEAISLPDHWWARTHAGEIDLVTVPGVGHWLAEEAPAETAAHLRRILLP